MWLLLAREPYPDAPHWPGRRLLAAIDALAWPMLVAAGFSYVPEPVGLAGPFISAVSLLAALGRLQRAVWANHRYRFTTWRCVRVATALLLMGVVLKLMLPA
jgi:hypothetical protein